MANHIYHTYGSYGFETMGIPIIFVSFVESQKTRKTRCESDTIRLDPAKPSGKKNGPVATAGSWWVKMLDKIIEFLVD